MARYTRVSYAASVCDGNDWSPLPASKPAILISSPNSSQCKPLLLSSYFCRCSGVALSSRGNQTNGTPIVLPSARVTSGDNQTFASTAPSLICICGGFLGLPSFEQKKNLYDLCRLTTGIVPYRTVGVVQTLIQALSL